MNDSFRHLERLERELGEIALRLTQVHFAQFGVADRWSPATVLPLTIGRATASKLLIIEAPEMAAIAERQEKISDPILVSPTTSGLP